MVTTIGSITLWITRMARSLAFYRKIGIPPRFVSPDRQFAMLDTGGCTLQLHAGGKPSARLQGAMHIDLTTRDVDRTYRAWKKKGVTFLKPPENMPWGERSAYLKDPDGYVFEISGPIPRTAKGARPVQAKRNRR